MKTSSVSLVILTATLLAVPAQAQKEMPAADTRDETGGRMKKNHQELIKRYDKNGDNRLDEDEKAAAHAAMRKEGGGETDRRKLLLKRFDKDGDGRLNEAERTEAEKTRQRLQQKDRGGKFRDQVIKRFDQNGDGQLDEQERTAAEKFRAEQVRKFDQDGDGRLDDAEREVARMALMADQPTDQRKQDR